MYDHRIIRNGVRLPFTCENRKYRTDITRGYAHDQNHNHLGSVTQEAIYDDGNGYTLWLEYVINVRNPNDRCMWFMWYDDNGLSTMPMSSVIDEADINEVIRNISQIRF